MGAVKGPRKVHKYALGPLLSLQLKPKLHVHGMIVLKSRQRLLLGKKEELEL